MNRIAIPFLFLVACATDSSTELDGGKSDGARSAHAKAVAACAGEDLAAHRCVRAANEAATDTIDGLIPEAEHSSLALFEDFEDRAGEVCATFSETLVEDSRPAFVARCRAQRSRDLASLIDGYVIFEDGDRITVPHREADFVECREAYRAAFAKSTSTADSIDAAVMFRECIEAETALAAGELAALLDLPEAEASQRIAGALDTALGGAINACTVVAAATGEAGGSLEQVFTAECQADAAAQIGSLVLDSIPGD